MLLQDRATLQVHHTAIHKQLKKNALMASADIRCHTVKIKTLNEMKKFNFNF
jgi:hypothetical protein